MVTISKDLPHTFADGFTFARRTRDPQFRQHLKDIGWHSDQDIVMAEDMEPVTAVIARIIDDQASSPCLIAIRHDDEPFGFRFLFAEVAKIQRRWWRRPPPHRRTQPISIAHDASIGMLYSSLQRCGEYIPNEWVKPVLFERPSA